MDQKTRLLFRTGHRSGGEHMICHECNHQNEDNSMFCKNCGVVLSKKEKLSLPFPLKTGIWVSIFVSIIIIVGIILGTRRNDPIAPIIKEIDSGNYSEALLLYDECRAKLDDENRQKVRDYIKKIAEDIQKSYMDGTIDCETALSSLKQFGAWGFSTLSKHLQDAMREMENMENCTKLFKTAEDLMEHEKYDEAMQYYLLIPNTDRNYATAQSQYHLAQQKYEELIISEAERIAGNKDYPSAIAIVEDGFNVLPDNEAFIKQIASYQKTYVAYNIEIARAYFEAEEFKNALECLMQAYNTIADQDLLDKYDQYADEYVRKTMMKVENYIANEDYYHAIEDLNQALNVLPDNSELYDAYEKYNWTTVLYSDDDYLIVRKDFETYDSYQIKVGVLTSEGKWIVPLTEDHIFANAIKNESGKTTLTLSKTSITDDNVYHLGEGVFVLSLGVQVRSASGGITNVGNCSSVGSSGLTCYLYNATTGTQSTFSAVWLSLCENGYMLMYNSNRYNSCFYRVDSEGTVSALPVNHRVNDYRVSGYSEGLFFANGYFYDIFGNIHIDLTAYKITNAPYFKNGECTICFKNAAGTLYTAVIDMTGKFIVDPVAA